MTCHCRPDVTTFTAANITDMMYAGYGEQPEPLFVHIGRTAWALTIGSCLLM